MFYDSFLENPKSITYHGEDSDEQILYVLRQSFILNIPWILGTLLLLLFPPLIFPLLPKYIGISFKFSVVLFWYLVLFGYAFQRFINWFFNVYIISDKKIVDVDFHGIMYKKISEATLDSVEDVTSTVKGLTGILFNIGHVYIQTAAENREFEFEGILNPSKVRDIISDLVAKKKQHHH